MTNEKKIYHQEFTIKDIMDHFIKGFNIEGESVVEGDYWFDQHKNTAMIKLVTEPKENTNEG